MGSPSQQTCSQTTDKTEAISLRGCDLEECRFWHGCLLWLSLPSAGGWAAGATRLLLLPHRCVRWSSLVLLLQPEQVETWGRLPLPANLAWISLLGRQHCMVMALQPASLLSPPCGNRVLPCPAPPPLIFSLPTLRAATWKTQEGAGKSLCHQERGGGIACWICRRCYCHGTGEQKGSCCSRNKGANPQSSSELIYLPQVLKSALPNMWTISEKGAKQFSACKNKVLLSGCKQHFRELRALVWKHR